MPQVRAYVEWQRGLTVIHLHAQFGSFCLWADDGDTTVSTIKCHIHIDLLSGKYLICIHFWKLHVRYGRSEFIRIANLNTIFIFVIPRTTFSCSDWLICCLQLWISHLECQLAPDVLRWYVSSHNYTKIRTWHVTDNALGNLVTRYASDVVQIIWNRSIEVFWSGLREMLTIFAKFLDKSMTKWLTHGRLCDIP